MNLLHKQCAQYTHRTKVDAIDIKTRQGDPDNLKFIIKLLSMYTQ